MPTPSVTPAGAKRWRRSDFRAGSAELAPRLIGCTLVRILDDGTRLAGIIVETEAYLGVEDAAAHSFGGRRTARNEAMYARPGTAYVYFTYGMHHCVNVVCGEVDEPVAVLIRALEPVAGAERMAEHRSAKRSSPSDLRANDLCSGPGKLCQALAIDRDLNGEDLVASARLLIERRSPRHRVELATGPRIGVAYAGEWAHKPLRWWARENEHVSRRS